VGPDQTLRYGDGPDQVIDLRLPGADGPRPLVVVVHGGFWRAEWDRAHAGPQSDALAAAGYVVATAEYRRVGQPGGGWPGTFDDVAALTDGVRRLVVSAVGARVDTRRTVLVGHSAGGHLAAWAAARHRLAAGASWHRADPVATGVVSLAGVLDLPEAARLGLGAGATEAMLGGTPDEHPGRYASASPAALVPTGVRLRLVHGADDDQVPVGISRGYLERARAAGDDVTLRTLAGTGHFELIDPGSAAWPAVLAAVRDAAGPEAQV
jgi:acetyl esterase/lipase